MRRALLHYPLQHWRGVLPLGIAWWLNCVALTVLVWVGAPRIAVALGVAPATDALRYTGAVAMNAAVTGLLPLWQLTGLWRAAARRAAADAAPTRWTFGRWGQVAALFFTLFAAGRGLTTGADSVIGARVAYAVGPYGYTLTVLPGGREIELAGGIALGATRDLAALLASNPGVRRIRLNSGGGALSEAQQLRRLIQKNRLDTITTTGCSSACVSAYLGGRFRYLQRGARMGVHLPRNWQPLSRGGIAPPFVAELRYLQRRGLPDWFIARWIQSGQQFWYPGNVVLLRAGVVNFIRGGPPALQQPASDPVL